MKFVLKVFVALVLFGCQMTRGQRQSDFKFYTFYDRYDHETKSYLKNNGYVEATLITPFYIDPHKKNKAELVYVKRFIERTFPEKNQSGVCVVNWEDKPYQDMINFKKSDKSFIQASAEFEKVVSYIKELRPNLKVGVYGFPVRVVSEGMEKLSADNKFDALFRVCDFISPSLYLMYTDEEKGHEWNLNYFSRNLDLAKSYAKRLGKPVIPFVWSKIHPSNKVSGMKPIPVEVMKSYLEFIHHYDNNMVAGVFWWDPKPQAGNSNVSEKAQLSSSSKEKSIDEKSISELILEYTGELNKKVRQEN